MGRGVSYINDDLSFLWLIGLLILIFFIKAVKQSYPNAFGTVVGLLWLSFMGYVIYIFLK